MFWGYSQHDHRSGDSLPDTCHDPPDPLEGELKENPGQNTLTGKFEMMVMSKLEQVFMATQSFCVVVPAIQLS